MAGTRAAAASLVIALLVLFGAAPAWADFGKRYALVIGNSAYAHVEPLPNTARDAEAMAEALEALRFTVFKGIDLTGNEFERLIYEFDEAAADADTVVFYYAGHGFQLDGLNYLAPVDAVLQDRERINAETFVLNDVIARIHRRQRQTIVFLDACRNNPLPPGARDGTAEGLAQVGTGDGTFIAFATQPGNVSYDGSSKNSPFTEALITHIGKPNRNISQLMIEVRNEVSDRTVGRQVPWDQSSLRADFYFNPTSDYVALDQPSKGGLVIGAIGDSAVADAADLEPRPAVSIGIGTAAAPDPVTPPIAAPKPLDKLAAAVASRAEPGTATTTAARVQAEAGSATAAKARVETGTAVAARAQPGAGAVTTARAQPETGPATAAKSQPDIATAAAAPRAKADAGFAAKTAPAERDTLMAAATAPAQRETLMAAAAANDDRDALTAAATDALEPGPVRSGANFVAVDRLKPAREWFPEDEAAAAESAAEAEPAVEFEPSRAEERQMAALDPQTPLVPEAEKQPEEPLIDQQALARSIQSDLARLGCYRLSVDGDWGPGSRRSLEQYYREKGQPATSLEPSTELLTMLQDESGTVCEPPKTPKKPKVAAPTQKKKKATASTAKAQPPRQAPPPPPTAQNQPAATPKSPKILGF